MSKITVLGVDFGSNTGLCCAKVNPEKPIVRECSFARIKNPTRIQCARAITDHKPDVIIIESPFIRPGKLSGIEGLYRNYFHWVFIAEMQDIPLRRIHVPTWQAFLKNKYGIKRGSKEDYIELAESLLKEPVEAHCADAYLFTRIYLQLHQEQPLLYPLL